MQQKKDSNGWLIAIAIIILISIVGSFGSCETQYDRDFESAQNKTWDEMTPGERDAAEDYINWEIKQSEKQGADWDK